MSIFYKELEQSEFEIKYYKNQLLPQVDLRASFWYPGQSGNFIKDREMFGYTFEVP